MHRKVPSLPQVGTSRNAWKRPLVASIVVLFGVAALPLGPAQAEHGAVPAADPHFVDIAEDAGLDFTCKHWHKGLGLGARWFIDVLFCASPVLLDLNGDGYTDLFFPNMRYSYQSLNDAEAPRDGWFLNNGDGTFTDITDFVDIADEGYSGGGAAVDLDDDGDLDIVVVNFPNQAAWYPALQDVSFDSPSFDVYWNEGDGRFTRSVAPGLVTEPRFTRADNQMGQAIAAADYDHDGDLDLYRGNYIQYQLPQGMPAGLQLTVPDSNNLYRNNGDGTFSDVTIAAGASSGTGRTFAVNFVDLNHDMLPDLYVANDENPNEVYLNNGDGTFTDVSTASGANDPRGSMCSEAADWNNDGNLDLYMSHYENEYNGYYLGNGDGTFVEQSTAGDLGISWDILGWACPAWDYDNDGDQDLFVANGHMLPIGGQFPGGDDGYELPNFLFRNRLVEDGVHHFEDVRASAGPGLADRFASSGAVPIDIDLDGVQELVVVENNDVPTKLYRNTASVDGHWLEVNLDSGGANRFGIGAKVVVTAGGLVQTQYQYTGDTLASGSVAPLRFGLGDHDGPVTVAVTWPGPGTVTDVVTTPVDRPVRIHKGGTVAHDTLAPAVDVDVAGTLGDDGWYTSPSLDITLRPHERGIGAQGHVTAVAYALDGGPLTPYTGTFSVTGEGAHRLVVRATDSNGNSAWYPHMFKIDSETPDCRIDAPLRGKVYLQDRVIGDSHDGRTYMVTPVQTPDSLADKADFLVTTTQEWIGDFYGIETPPVPVSLAGLLSDSVGSEDGRTQVDAYSADATSGVRTLAFQFDGVTHRQDTAAPYAWRADLRGQTVGTHVLTIEAVDHAGNRVSEDLEIEIVPSTQDGALNTAMELVGGL